ncbi:MAG: segregation and condensation protein B [Parcubacteria group bacterium Gr01-1014_8]|nr:MAG: segregation and condensation protein B [Parcubacteria group bacterium Gr01-1014_8]
MDLASKIHALLFAEGDSLTLKKLAQFLDCDQAELLGALNVLEQTLKNTPLTVVRTDKEVALAVSAGIRDTVAAAQLKEQEREIGDAGLEVLTILLYDGPSTRADIDYIRGVNSSSTLRTLLSRGLAERAGNPEDGREYLYRPTVELLAHLGVANTEKLPDYDTIARELKAFKSKNEIFNENAHSQNDGNSS